MEVNDQTYNGTANKISRGYLALPRLCQVHRVPSSLCLQHFTVLQTMRTYQSLMKRRSLKQESRGRGTMRNGTPRGKPRQSGCNRRAKAIQQKGTEKRMQSIAKRCRKKGTRNGCNRSKAKRTKRKQKGTEQRRPIQRGKTPRNGRCQ